CNNCGHPLHFGAFPTKCQVSNTRVYLEADTFCNFLKKPSRVVALGKWEGWKRHVVGKILEPEIRSMIEARNFAALREVFREWPPADVAEVILDLPENEQVIIFRVLPHYLAADVFEYLDLDAQQKLLRPMAHEQVVGILNEMAPDDRTALLEELPSAAARQLIKLLTPEERQIAQSLLGYPEGSVGRLMTPDFIAVHDDWTVQQVLDFVREHGQDRQTPTGVFVVDDRGKL